MFCIIVLLLIALFTTPIIGTGIFLDSNGSVHNYFPDNGNCISLSSWYICHRYYLGLIPLCDDGITTWTCSADNDLAMNNTVTNKRVLLIRKVEIPNAKFFSFEMNFVYTCDDCVSVIEIEPSKEIISIPKINQKYGNHSTYHPIAPNQEKLEFKIEFQENPASALITDISLHYYSEPPNVVIEYLTQNVLVAFERSIVIFLTASDNYTSLDDNGPITNITISINGTLTQCSVNGTYKPTNSIAVDQHYSVVSFVSNIAGITSSTQNIFVRSSCDPKPQVEQISWDCENNYVNSTCSPICINAPSRNDVEVICSHTETWHYSGNGPPCSCIVPPMNSQTGRFYCDSERLTPGSNCTFRCNDGYHSVSTFPVIICGKDGGFNWNNDYNISTVFLSCEEDVDILVAIFTPDNTESDILVERNSTMTIYITLTKKTRIEKSTFHVDLYDAYTFSFIERIHNYAFLNLQTLLLWEIPSNISLGRYVVRVWLEGQNNTLFFSDPFNISAVVVSNRSRNEPVLDSGKSKPYLIIIISVSVGALLLAVFGIAFFRRKPRIVIKEISPKSLMESDDTSSTNNIKADDGLYSVVDYESSDSAYHTNEGSILSVIRVSSNHEELPEQLEQVPEQAIIYTTLETTQLHYNKLQR